MVDDNLTRSRPPEIRNRDGCGARPPPPVSATLALPSASALAGRSFSVVYDWVPPLTPHSCDTIGCKIMRVCSPRYRSFTSAMIFYSPDRPRLSGRLTILGFGPPKLRLRHARLLHRRQSPIALLPARKFRLLIVRGMHGIRPFPSPRSVTAIIFKGLCLSDDLNSISQTGPLAPRLHTATATRKSKARTVSDVHRIHENQIGALCGPDLQHDRTAPSRRPSTNLGVHTTSMIQPLCRTCTRSARAGQHFGAF